MMMCEGFPSFCAQPDQVNGGFAVRSIGWVSGFRAVGMPASQIASLYPAMLGSLRHLKRVSALQHGPRSAFLGLLSFGLGLLEAFLEGPVLAWVQHCENALQLQNGWMSHCKEWRMNCCVHALMTFGFLTGCRFGGGALPGVLLALLGVGFGAPAQRRV